MAQQPNKNAHNWGLILKCILLGLKLLNYSVYVVYDSTQDRSNSNTQKHPAVQSLSFQQVSMAGVQHPMEHLSLSQLFDLVCCLEEETHHSV